VSAHAAFAHARAAHGGRGRGAQAPVVAIIAGRPCERRAKWQLGVAAGLPLLKPAWAEACATAGAMPPAAAAPHAWLPRRRGLARPLAGLRVHLAGAEAFRAQYGALLPHAGARPPRRAARSVQAPLGLVKNDWSAFNRRAPLGHRAHTRAHHDLAARSRP
jgi:hypothetical protein